MKLLGILSVPRSGTNHLMKNILGSSSRVLNLGEIFHNIPAGVDAPEAFMEYSDYQELRLAIRLDPGNTLRRISSHANCEAVVFKVFPDHLNADEFSKLCASTDCFIFLQRNLLSTWVSNKIAEASGNWFSSKTEDHIVDWDLSDFLAYASGILDFQCSRLACLKQAGVPTLRLKYSELNSLDPAADRIWREVSRISPALQGINDGCALTANQSGFASGASATLPPIFKQDHRPAIDRLNDPKAAANDLKLIGLHCLLDESDDYSPEDLRGSVLWAIERRGGSDRTMPHSPANTSVLQDVVLRERDAAIETARVAEAFVDVLREKVTEAENAREAAEASVVVLREKVTETEDAHEAAERRAAEAESAPARHLQSLVDAGDRLAEDLRRANARPWRPLKRALQRGVLRLVLVAGPLLSDRRRGRLRRSLDKRLPSVPGREWDTVVTGVLDEAGVILPQRSRPTDRMRSSISYRVLILLADLSEPFSKRRARRFRRSAAKRAPDNFRQISTPLQATGDDAGASPVADQQRAKRILVADYRLPRADVSAGERATVGLLGDLVALGYDVVFLPLDMAEDVVVRARLEGMGVKVVTGADGFGFPAAYIRDHGHCFGAFYLIRVDVAEALLPSARAVAPDARLIFHAPDLHVLRETRAAELGGAPADMARAQETGAREAAIVRAADHVVLVSPAELPLVAEMTDPARISVFPALYSPVASEPTDHAARQHVFFLGGFGHSANPPAVKWFVNEI